MKARIGESVPRFAPETGVRPLAIEGYRGHKSTSSRIILRVISRGIKKKGIQEKEHISTRLFSKGPPEASLKYTSGIPFRRGKESFFFGALLCYRSFLSDFTTPARRTPRLCHYPTIPLSHKHPPGQAHSSCPPHPNSSGFIRPQPRVERAKTLPSPRVFLILPLKFRQVFLKSKTLYGKGISVLIFDL